MRSIYVAKWILALVTSRDRAASTAGDLAEGTAARGADSQSAVSALLPTQFFDLKHTPAKMRASRLFSDFQSQPILPAF